MIKLFITLLLISTTGYAVNLTDNVHNPFFHAKNLFRNPGAESGRAKYGASTAAQLTLTTTAAQVANGARALAYDAAAATDQMFSETIVVPPYLQGKNCLAKFIYKNGDANLDAQITDLTNNIATVTLSTQAEWTEVDMSFVCPTSGSMRIEIEATADAAAIHVDSFYLGSNYLLGTVTQSQLIGSVFFATTANCIWTGTSATIADFPVDTDCPGPTIEVANVGTWLTTDTDLPQVTVNNLPSGDYMAHFQITVASDANSQLSFDVGDGTTSSGLVAHRVNGSSRRQLIDVIGYFSYSAAGNRTFRIRGAINQGGTTAELWNNVQNQTIRMRLYKYPSASQITLTPDQSSWYVNANMGGDNPSLGTAGVSPYAQITNASLDTIVNSGSAPALQACSSGDSTGLTCSGTESVGIAFTVPIAGDYMVCNSFSWLGNVSSGSINVTFELVETPNAAVSITQRGNTRLFSQHESGAGANVENAMPQRLCGVFNFASAGKKTVRMFYTQTATSANSSVIIGDRSGSNNGDRDMHWEAYHIRSFIQTPLILNHVSTDNSSGVNINVAELECDATPQILSQSGAWAASLAENATGDCTLTFTAGYFANTPVCTLTARANSARSATLAGATTTSVDIMFFDSAGAAATANSNINCVGYK